MPHRTFRAAVACATFLAGLASVWLSGLGAGLETRLADWLAPAADVSVPAPPLVGREESDTQAVYETVLREMFGGGSPDWLLVLDPEAGGLTLSGRERAEVACAGEEALDDFVSKNGVTRALPPLTHLAAAQVRLDYEDYQRMFKDPNADGWQTFKRLYPNSSGYLSLSAVGFNRAGDRALLYLTQNCGWLCAQGTYVLLSKGPSGWAVVQKRVIWVS